MQIIIKGTKNYKKEPRKIRKFVCQDGSLAKGIEEQNEWCRGMNKWLGR